MTRIVLDIPHHQDMVLLMDICQRLGIRVVQRSEVQANTAPQESDAAIHSEKWKAIVKPLRQSQSIEDMILEQGYKGFDRATFDRIIEALDIQDVQK